MSTLRAIVVRDFRVAWSYRFSFIVQTGSIIFSLLSLKFFAGVFGPAPPPALAEYGGDFFAFTLLGAGMTYVSYPAVKCFAQTVRSAQVTGTLEAMLSTRARPAAIILGSGVWPLAAAVIQVALLVIVGAVMGAELRIAHLGLALTVLVLLLVSLAGLGLLSAAFVVAFKQNEPFTGAFLAGAFLLSGVFYPTSVLPRGLEQLAMLLPTTHAMELTRGLLLGDAGAASYAGHFVALVAFCLLLPTGLLAFSRSIAWAKASGSLGQY